jgi:hypothetical protein
MNRAIALLFFLCAVAAAPPAAAQLGDIVPSLPSLPVIEDLEIAAPDTRALRVRELLRSRRGVIEADPNGEPVVRGQILALGLSEAAQARARAEGFEIVRIDRIEGQTALVTLRAPRGMSTRRALRRLRDADPQAIYDFDHLHLESGPDLAGLSMAQAGADVRGARVGLIDSGVETSVGAVVVQRAFAGDAPVAAAHGTAIAQLLSRSAPGVSIYAADIYGGAPTGGASSALARALLWLASEDVPVINVSLVGPRNRIVEAIVSRLSSRGVVIVAAVGNDGPAAAPLYPAAYEQVIGVTGVDARQRVLPEAGRGAHVDFAALAVQGRARGTSYAAPIVSGELAMLVRAPSLQTAAAAIAALRARALDLGERGRDDAYGYGLIEAN